MGTDDTINNLIANGSSTLSTVLKTQAAQKATAVKAQTQIATSQTNAIALVAIAIVAVIGFLFFARMKG